MDSSNSERNICYLSIVKTLLSSIRLTLLTSTRSESGADTSNFFKPFYVWILSQWFKDQSVIATVSRNTDAYTFHKYGHDSRFPISCDYYEANNICSAWWHHGAANATYSLDNLSKGKSDKNYYEAMTNLFGSNLFSGADLFLNRDVCENPRPFVIRDGRTVSCSIYAEIQMAEFSPTCNDLGCEFGGEPDSQADWKVDLCFPASYLGDLRSMEGTKFVPCSYRNA